ncbi:MAG: phosphonate metabolism transcriptional regulator PhnF [Phyllobacteriaceae bacterium]|jgi:GntR family phosphonate transport system transcriptional regulator|nr:phosphonate metabolism transcriptional regulator PhnF [Phyllobacteriaceae bacterium]
MPSTKRWEIVQTAILNDIKKARLTAGQKLPNDNQLAERFGVNRHTVRHAIKAMETKGVLRVVHGRGTFVVNEATRYLLSPKTRLTENLLAQGLVARRDVLDSAIFEAGEKFAGLFDIDVSAQVLRVDTLSYHNDIPRTIAHNYFPMSRTPDLLDAFSGTNSITDALKRVGINDYRRCWTRVDGRLPTQAEADLLQMSRAQPVFETQSLDAVDETPIKYGENILCCERITLEIDFSAVGRDKLAETVRY